MTVSKERYKFKSIVMWTRLLHKQYLVDIWQLAASRCLIRRLPRPQDRVHLLNAPSVIDLCVGGHPSKYNPSPMLPDFGDCLGTGSSTCRPWEKSGYSIKLKYDNFHLSDITICSIKRKKNFFSLFFFSSAKNSCFITSAPLAREQKNSGKQFFILSDMKFCFMKRLFTPR
jgi:hypothetical protein